MEAIILAGGFGTRLAQKVKDVPKSMAPVNGKPFLEYLIEYLKKNGINRIILAVGYKKESIMEYFGKKFHGVEIIYSIETEPLLTGGAIKNALPFVESPCFLVLNGDTYFDIDLSNMIEKFHKNNKEILMAIKKMDHFSRYGSLEVDEEGKVLLFKEKKYCQSGYINGGIYCMKKEALLSLRKNIFSLETDFFPLQLIRHQLYTYVDEGFFIDIGVPEDYEKVQIIFEENLLL